MIRALKLFPSPPFAARTPSRLCRWRLRGTLAGALLLAGAATCRADEPAPAVPDFSPPPVPAFMLRKPERPLTLEEMRQQADAAAARARAERVQQMPLLPSANVPVSPSVSTGEKPPP